MAALSSTAHLRFAMPFLLDEEEKPSTEGCPMDDSILDDCSLDDSVLDDFLARVGRDGFLVRPPTGTDVVLAAQYRNEHIMEGGRTHSLTHSLTRTIST